MQLLVLWHYGALGHVPRRLLTV